MEPMETYLATLDQDEKDKLALAALNITAHLMVEHNAPARYFQGQVERELQYGVPQELIDGGQYEVDGKVSIDAVNYWRNLLGWEQINEMPSRTRPGATEVRVMPPGSHPFEVVAALYIDVDYDEEG